ncbi:MAG: hypothetical protein JWL86_2103 [Rhizobium sp.]|nr:hypothetical protein [Rhizobium sp.]
MKTQASLYGNFKYHYIASIPADGIEYRHCHSDEPVAHFGYAVWLEQCSDDIARVMDTPIYTLTKTAAKSLAQDRCDEFRRLRPPCTFHRIIVPKEEFQSSSIRDDYKTLRRWVLAQGLAKADFAVTPNRNYYALSFRTMDRSVEDAILFLKMAGVFGSQGYTDRILVCGGRLEDLRGYKS